MRVCFISYESPSNIEGGAGIYAETIIKGLKYSDVDLFVISEGRQKHYHNKFYTLTTPNFSYWRRFFFMKSAMSVFTKLNKIREFDIVHFNEPHIIFSKFNIPTVYTFHSNQFNEMKLKIQNPDSLKTLTDFKDLIIKNSVGSICDIITAQTANKIICPTPYLAKLIKHNCFVNEEDICIIPNGINLNQFDKITEYDKDFLHMYNLDEDNYLFFMGRLIYLKGVNYLLKAFKNIKKLYSDIKLVIAGTGDKHYESYLKKITGEIEDVVFTGYINSLKIKKTLYDNSLAVIVPSIYETLPMVILEAMACGKVVISNDVGGIPLLVRHGKNGFLGVPRNSKSLEKYIRILLEYPDLREDMGRYGRKLVEKEFTAQKMVDTTLKLYHTMLA